MGRVAAALATMLVAACFSKPPAPGETGTATGDADVSHDAATDADADAFVPLDRCDVINTFTEEASGCGPWASSSGAGTIARTGGVLALGASTAFPMDATCTANADETFTSVTVEVASFASVALVDGNILLRFADDLLRIQVQGSTGDRYAYTEDPLAYTLIPWTTETRYVRVSNVNGTVTVELGDGNVWTFTQDIPITGSVATVRVVLEARYTGTPDGTPASTSVHYDNLDLCD